MNKKREEIPSKVAYIALNRSAKLEGQPGKYDGKEINSKYVLVGEMKAMIESTEGKEEVNVYDL